MKTLRHIVSAFTASFLLAASTSGAQPVNAVFEQNANGQSLGMDSCGDSLHASNDNLWTQSEQFAQDCHNQSFKVDVSNWNIPKYPNGANFNVTIGNHDVHLNESVTMGDLTIGAGGTLALDANNSSGGGAHAITVGFSGGTITNNGNLNSTGPTEAGQTYQFNVPTLLTGTGTTRFDYGTVLTGPGALTVDTNHKVIGGGDTEFQAPLVNKGIINADGSTGFFEHRELTFTNTTITNTGTIKATANGIVQFLAATVVDNTGGTLSASGNYSFNLTNGVSVTGGTLISIGDRPRADFFQVNNASLTNVKLATGTEMFVDGGILNLNGAIANNGRITFANTQNPAGTGRFNIASDTTISGIGQLIVVGSPNTIAAGKTLTLGPAQVLDAGFTAITGAVTNQGLINATSDRGLTLNGGPYTNSGIIESSGSGYLGFGIQGTTDQLTFTIDNTGGAIQAIDSSLTEFIGNITVQNGTLASSGTGALFMQGQLTLQGVTNNATFHLRRNCSSSITLRLEGEFTNNGVIDDLQGECNPPIIDLLGDVSIAGTGSFNLYRNTTINSDSNGVLTIGEGQSLGGNVTINPTLINNGIVSIGGDSNIQSLNGPMVTNNGTLLAGEGGTIQQAANSVLTNYDANTETLTGGTYIARNGVLNLNIGAVVINAASVSLIGSNGQFPAINSIHENRGSFEVNGGRKFTVAAPPAADAKASSALAAANTAFANYNNLTVGSNSSINVSGDFVQGSVATLNIEIGSDNPATGLAQLNVAGNAKLAGRLNVTLVGGFKPKAGQKFQILTAASRSGSFAEVYGATISYSATGVTIHPTGAPIPPAGQLLNISSRLRVLTGDRALIGGFIVTGTDPKKVIIRGLGPSLTAKGVPDALQDPTLELFNDKGSIAKNDNWKQTQEAEIKATGVAPTKDAESAIVRTLPPGSYTAVLRGQHNSVGVGALELYDLATAANSKLANISARGFVDSGDNALIGGFIAGALSGGPNTKVAVRAIGPSLSAQGVSDPLADPTLALVDANGATVRANDNWRTDQEAELEAIGIQPKNDAEAALVATLPAGSYTAIVRGADNGTGIGVVEVYNLQ